MPACKWMLIAAFGAWASVPTATNAQPINGDDLFLTDPTPLISFDDTNSTGVNFNVWGMDEFFSISDPDAPGSFFVYLPAGKQSIALGIDAWASGGFSAALGREASSDGFASIALGRTASSGGWASTALGYRATAEGDNSTALGYLATAPNLNTIVLGSIEGENQATFYTDVAIGTTAPLAPLHIYRDDGTASILVSDAGPVVGPKTLFEIENNGNPEFRLTNTANNNSWVFSAGLRFVVKNSLGDWVMRVTDTGNLEIGGTLLEMSDREQKHAIEPLDGEAVLAKVSQVPISEWSYKTESADQRHIGPMAQDFHAAFGLASGEKRISARDMAGVNMAAVQALNQKLEGEVAMLREELEQMKALLLQVLPRTANN